MGTSRAVQAAKSASSNGPTTASDLARRRTLLAVAATPASVTEPIRSRRSSMLTTSSWRSRPAPILDIREPESSSDSSRSARR